jgi:hypothetical protein
MKENEVSWIENLSFHTPGKAKNVVVGWIRARMRSHMGNANRE